MMLTLGNCNINVQFGTGKFNSHLFSGICLWVFVLTYVLCYKDHVYWGVKAALTYRNKAKYLEGSLM